MLRRLAVLLAGFTSACLGPTDDGDDGSCLQTYEFGNTGCVEVRGQVVSTNGQALAYIIVTPRPASKTIGFDGGYATSDADGRFRVRLSRMAGVPPAGGMPDTLSVYVVATGPESAGINIPASVRDSVLTVVSVAPVGKVPTPAEVRIVLPAS
jgi:hypothetical protein